VVVESLKNVVGLIEVVMHVIRSENCVNIKNESYGPHLALSSVKNASNAERTTNKHHH
jgi:hypothetical protein